MKMREKMKRWLILAFKVVGLDDLIKLVLL